MLCRYKDAMKKIECRGGKPTVLWGVSGNPLQLYSCRNNSLKNPSNIMEFQKETFDYPFHICSCIL